MLAVWDEDARRQLMIGCLPRPPPVPPAHHRCVTVNSATDGSESLGASISAHAELEVRLSTIWMNQIRPRFTSLPTNTSRESRILQDSTVLS